jgi:hypothetical protein
MLPFSPLAISKTVRSPSGFLPRSFHKPSCFVLPGITPLAYQVADSSKLQGYFLWTTIKDDTLKGEYQYIFDAKTMMPVYFAPFPRRNSEPKGLIFRYEKDCQCYAMTQYMNSPKGKSGYGLIMDSDFVVRDTIRQVQDAHWFSVQPDGYLCLGLDSSGEYKGHKIQRLDKDKKTIFSWSSFDSLTGIPAEQSFRDDCYTSKPHSDYLHANSLASIWTPLGRYTGICSRHLNEVTIFREEDKDMIRIGPLKTITYNPKTKQSSPLKSVKNSHSNVTWMNDSIGFTGAHDLRFVYYSDKDSSIYFTLWDNASCSQRISKFMLMKLQIPSKQLYVIRTFSVNKFGEFQGSGQLVLDNALADKEADLLSANVAFNHGNFDFPGTFFLTSPQFGIADTAGHILFGAYYENKYETELYQFQQAKSLPIHQPTLKCKQIKAGSYVLSVEGKPYNEIHWLTGAQGSTITVSEAADYLAWMKNENMFGYICSKPISVNDKTCPLLPGN